MGNRSLFLYLALMLFSTCIYSQKDFYAGYSFTWADTLRGMLRPARTAYDVHFYEIDIKVDPAKQLLEGHVDFHFTAEEDFRTLQIDLYENMIISKIVHKGKEMKFRREFDAVFIDFLPTYKKGESGSFRVYYHGNPHVARNAPWDGGFVWSRDRNNNPWIAVACQGAGASLWWPCKDHLSDEPDSLAIHVSAPDSLMCVANGDLRSKASTEGNNTRWSWFVSYPINTYNVSINIANYAHFNDYYIAGDGDSLRMDFYVLSYNVDRAKKHFMQTHKMFACFERYFGKYPFWNDGFALVETPYLGMEHQSAIAYGNEYMRGYKGGMIPQDMTWDYLIIHETGHEWWGNSISVADLSEMWIHESFTTYMEALYVECAYSYEDAIRYLAGQRNMIANRQPILGPKNVNWEKWDHSDHYFKGSWFLHTLRHAINDDEVWFDLLRSFYDKHAYSLVTTTDFLQYVNHCTKRDWSKVFEQYLEYPSLPLLEYKVEDSGKFSFRWDADVKGFDMPMLVGKEGEYQKIFPTTEWQTFELKGVGRDEMKVATELFLIKTKEVKG